MKQAPRHFLELTQIASEELRRIVEMAASFKRGDRLNGTSAGRQGAGDDFRKTVDADACVVRSRDEAARRHCCRDDTQRNADRPRRDHRRYRARPVALCRCDHDADDRERQTGGTGVLCRSAGDQRPDRSFAPMSVDGRYHDIRGTQGRYQRQAYRLVRRR